MRLSELLMDGMPLQVEMIDFSADHLGFRVIVDKLTYARFESAFMLGSAACWDVVFHNTAHSFAGYLKSFLVASADDESHIKVSGDVIITSEVIVMDLELEGAIIELPDGRFDALKDLRGQYPNMIVDRNGMVSDLGEVADDIPDVKVSIEGIYRTDLFMPIPHLEDRKFLEELKVKW